MQGFCLFFAFFFARFNPFWGQMYSNHYVLYFFSKPYIDRYGKVKLTLLGMRESVPLEQIYICELMVRCKEFAVRVSQDVWESIENAMVMPTPENES
jgi:hypothetical protein